MYFQDVLSRESRMSDLEMARGTDGNFHFKLCYPELAEAVPYEDPCNEWIQSSNPATTNTVKDYKKIRIPFTDNGDGDDFNGLSLSVAPRDEPWANISASGESPWYCIEIKKFRSKSSKEFPGPLLMGVKTWVTTVQLFVQTGKFNINKKESLTIPIGDTQMYSVFENIVFLVIIY